MFSIRDRMGNGTCPKFPDCRPERVCKKKSKWQIAMPSPCKPSWCKAKEGGPER